MVAIPHPIKAPTICAPMKGSTDCGAIPVKVLVNMRAKVTAGLAKDVEEVKK
jgi:hypothetical protein